MSKEKSLSSQVIYLEVENERLKKRLNILTICLNTKVDKDTRESILRMLIEIENLNENSEIIIWANNLKTSLVQEKL